MLRTLFFHPKLVGMEKRVEAPGVGDCGGGWGGRRSRSRLRTRTRQISFLSKNAILVPSPQGGEGWQRCAKACKSSQKRLEWPSSGGWRQTATVQPLGTTGAGEPGGKDTHCACVRGTASMGRALRGGGRSGTRSQCLAQGQQVAGSDLAPRPSHFGCWAAQKLCKQE